MNPSRPCLPLALLLLLLAAGCHSGDKHAVGAACDVDHPCRSFLICMDGRCQPPPGDSGPPPVTDRDGGPDTVDDVRDVSPAPDTAPDVIVDPGSSIADPPFDQRLLWPQRTLRYCWEIGRPPKNGVGNDKPASEHPSFAEMLNLTAKTAAETWGRAADIRFLDLGSCNSRDPDENFGLTSVYFAAGGPTADLGYSNNFATRVQLDPESPTRRADLIYALGRALGLRVLIHRPHIDLEPEQVVAARAAYGVKASGSLIGADNRCIEIGPGNRADGRALSAVECHALASQNWQWMPTLALLVKVGTASIPVCATAPAPFFTPTVGGFLESGFCTGEINQTFKFNGIQWRGPGNLCVALGGEAVAGTPLVLQTCLPGNRSKIWSADAGVLLRHGSSGLCALASFPQQPLGSALRLGACDDPLAKLTFTHSGAVFDTQLCATSPTAVPVTGQPLTWEACAETAGIAASNQQFHLSGRITGIHDLCLAKPAGQGAGSFRVGLEPCPADPASIQEWDFYF